MREPVIRKVVMKCTFLSKYHNEYLVFSITPDSRSLVSTNDSLLRDDFRRKRGGRSPWGILCERDLRKTASIATVSSSVSSPPSPVLSAEIRCASTRPRYIPSFAYRSS